MTTKKSGEKGFSLEYAVTGYFQGQGYLTRRSIPVHSGPANQDATDVDVVGIYFTMPFKGHRIICDCKNKQRSKPYERVFWAKGLGEFSKADDVYVSLPKVSSEIINFALKEKVRIVTSDKINEISSTPLGSYGVADEVFYKPIFDSINKVIKLDKLAERDWQTVRKLYLRDDPYTCINIAFSYLDKSLKQLKIDDKNADRFIFWRYLACELIVLVSLQLLWICEDTFLLSVEDRAERIINRLTYGQFQPTQVISLMQSAINLSKEVFRSYNPDAKFPQQEMVNIREMPAPTYAYSLIGLVERAINNPRWYIDLPQTIDFLLFEQGLKGKNFSDIEYRSMLRDAYPEEKMKVAKNIFAFLKETSGFEWAMILPKVERGDNSTSKNDSGKGVSRDTFQKITLKQQEQKEELAKKEDSNKKFQPLLDAKTLRYNPKNDLLENKTQDVRNTIKERPLVYLNNVFMSNNTKYKDLGQLLKENKFQSYNDIIRMDSEKLDEFAREISSCNTWDDFLEKAINDAIDRNIEELKKK
ncbi:hypothetical protein [Paenibacillus hubeiensis]|uniref:hypothetical protein n=1 Tax=Paenibacillus hubeiensis TaxID=3077330 RepID=UPI0031BAC4B1